MTSIHLTCRSCGSKRILRGARILAPGLLNADRLSVEVANGKAFSRSARSPVAAHVCVDCGNVEIHAVDLAELQRTYAELGEPLGLGTTTVEPEPS